MYIDFKTLWTILLLIVSLITTISAIARGEKWYAVLTIFFGGWWLAKLSYGLN